MENRRLRSDNPETSAQVDLEAELERAKGDVTTLMERVQVYEQQLAQVREMVTEYQQKLAELENQMRVAAEANWNGMADATRRSEEEREAAAEAKMAFE